ncbi:MFS transporter [Streptomyces sp. P6-2-1]|uniref:MFS transporter n=1 Tax=Streptomyces sp. P6-2-1 TaxID=3422591 RepID=UPI003D36117A
MPDTPPLATPQPTPSASPPAPAPDLASASAPAPDLASASAPAPDAASASAPAPDPAPAPAPAPNPTSAPAPAPGPRYLTLFRLPEFRAVFLAHLCSLLGTVVSEIALTVLVFSLTGSPFLSALAFALGFLPYLVGGTLLAGLADRCPPRRVLVGCDLVCAACVAVMALPVTPVAGLLALRVVLALVAPVFAGTRMATLGDILGNGDAFVLGRSLLRIVSQTALLGGYGVGGLLLVLVPPRGALLVTLATFLGSAALLRWGTRHRPARARTGAGGLVRDSLSGVRAVLALRAPRLALLLFWLPPAFAVVPEGLAAPYAASLGVGGAGLGLLLAALSAGMITGELLTGTLASPVTRARIALPLAALGTLPLALCLLRPGYVPLLALLFVTGASAAYTLGLDRWFVDSVPEALRGRAMTVQTAGLMTAQGLGTALAGAVAEHLAPHLVVAGAGLAGTVCCLPLALAARRARRAADAPGPKGETGLTTI